MQGAWVQSLAGTKSLHAVWCGQKINNKIANKVMKNSNSDKLAITEILL